MSLHLETNCEVTNALETPYLKRSVNTTIMSPFVSLTSTATCIHPLFLSSAERGTLGVYTEAISVSSNEGAVL
jgi:hypothetical protein